MERTQNALQGGVSGMVQSIRSNTPNLGGNNGNFSALGMLFNASKTMGRDIKHSINSSEWSVKEKGIVATLNKIGSLKRKKADLKDR